MSEFFGHPCYVWAYNSGLYTFCRRCVANSRAASQHLIPEQPHSNLHHCPHRIPTVLLMRALQLFFPNPIAAQEWCFQIDCGMKNWSPRTQTVRVSVLQLATIFMKATDESKCKPGSLLFCHFIWRGSPSRSLTAHQGLC